MPAAARTPPAAEAAEVPTATRVEEAYDPVFRFIRNGVETPIRASELPGANRTDETNGQRLIRALAKLPKPSSVEVRDTELIPEREGL